MSPPALRRYRAERLLRKGFPELRAKVLAVVRSQLRGKGITLDPADLEACYAQAWQGLYATVLGGEQVENPSAWLVLVTFRRAIDESRTAARAQAGSGARSAAAGMVLAGERQQSTAEHDVAWNQLRPTVDHDVARNRQRPASDHDVAWQQGVSDPDLAASLDDRARLRQVFEGLRNRLSARECEAASLCYLQGLSRAQAATQLGISEARMRKLMEGAGPGRPGVASKVGELLDTIKGGGWCEQQSSLMRAYAFGILDPDGPRHALAVVHCRECPACRAHVASLRGLASVLPPLPLRLVIGGGAGTAVGPGSATGGSSVATGSGVAGSLTAKLAVMALVVFGTGYAVLGSRAHGSPAIHRPAAVSRSIVTIPRSQAQLAATGATSTHRALHRARRSPVSHVHVGRYVHLTDEAAAREFGPERVVSSGTSPVPSVAPRPTGGASNEFGFE